MKKNILLLTIILTLVTSFSLPVLGASKNIFDDFNSWKNPMTDKAIAVVDGYMQPGKQTAEGYVAQMVYDKALSLGKFEFEFKFGRKQPDNYFDGARIYFFSNLANIGENEYILICLKRQVGEASYIDVVTHTKKGDGFDTVSGVNALLADTVDFYDGKPHRISIEFEEGVLEGTINVTLEIDEKYSAKLRNIKFNARSGQTAVEVAKDFEISLKGYTKTATPIVSSSKESSEQTPSSETPQSTDVSSDIESSEVSDVGETSIESNLSEDESIDDVSSVENMSSDSLTSDGENSNGGTTKIIVIILISVVAIAGIAYAVYFMMKKKKTDSNI